MIDYQPRGLAVVPALLTDESLTGWVLRCARSWALPVATAGQALGLDDRRARTPSATWRALNVDLTKEAQRRVHAATGIHTDQLQGALLGYLPAVGEPLLTWYRAEILPGRAAVGTDTATTSLAVPWVFSRYSRFCWRCLKEEPDVWPLRWRLAWVAACERHRLYLEHRCSSCGSPQGDPSQLRQPPAVNQCMSPDGERGLCARLDGPPGGGEGASADLQLLEAQRSLHALLDSCTPQSASSVGQVLRDLRDWSIVLSRFASPGDRPGWPTTSGWRSDSRKNAAPRRVITSYPFPARAVSEVLPVAAELSRDPRGHPELLARVAWHIQRRPESLDVFAAKNFSRPGPVAEVLAEHAERRTARIARSLVARAPRSDWVPLVLPWALYRGDLSDLLHEISPGAGRAIAAFWIRQMVTKLSASTVLAQMSLPPTRVGQIRRTEWILRRQGRSEALAAALEVALERLRRASVSYDDRRAALARCASLTDVAYRASARRLAPADARLWLWVEFGGGDPVQVWNAAGPAPRYVCTQARRRAESLFADLGAPDPVIVRARLHMDHVA